MVEVSFGEKVRELWIGHLLFEDLVDLEGFPGLIFLGVEFEGNIIESLPDLIITTHDPGYLVQDDEFEVGDIVIDVGLEMKVEKTSEGGFELLFLGALGMMLDGIGMKGGFLEFLGPSFGHHVHSLLDLLEDVVSFVGDDFVDDPFILGKFILKEPNIIF